MSSQGLDQTKRHDTGAVGKAHEPHAIPGQETAVLYVDSDGRVIADAYEFSLVDGNLVVRGVAVGSAAGVVRLPKLTQEQPAPASGLILYCLDDGTGKAQLVVRAPTGGTKVLFTEGV